jgi:hypothetical protein
MPVPTPVDRGTVHDIAREAGDALRHRGHAVAVVVIVGL